jgi:choline dehydrogenase-like flavoprotein
VQVTRVVIESGRAVGVQFIENGAPRTVRAQAEMLLAAGALQSPQLLQLSGIGPAAVLESHGIAVQANSSEVGENLQDHYQARVIVKLKHKKSLNDQARNPFSLAKMGAQWLFQQKGPLTVGAGQVGGMVCSPYAQNGRADLLLNVMPLAWRPATQILRLLCIRHAVPSSFARARSNQKRESLRGTADRGKLSNRSIRRQGTGLGSFHFARHLPAAVISQSRDRGRIRARELREVSTGPGRIRASKRRYRVSPYRHVQNGQ